MSGTQNRETALKNAINRSVTFNKIIENADQAFDYKILKINGNGFYKLFITDSNGSFSIEILNEKIFSVNGHPQYDIYVKLEGKILFLGNIAGNINMVVDYFESFEILDDKTTTDEFNRDSENDKFIRDTLTYTKDMKTSSLTVGKNIQSEIIATSGEIIVNKIKFGNWEFDLGYDEGNEEKQKISTQCYINYSYNKNIN